jgi:hypothetical protein
MHSVGAAPTGVVEPSQQLPLSQEATRQTTANDYRIWKSHILRQYKEKAPATSRSFLKKQYLISN